MYEIKCLFTTGDSFHTEETTDTLALCWRDLTTAKEALRWLNEHHNYYQEEKRDAYRAKPKKDNSDLKLKPWYVPGQKWGEVWHHSVTLPLDDGTLMQTHIPYHGYFEHLHSLEIILAKEDTDGLKIEY